MSADKGNKGSDSSSDRLAAAVRRAEQAVLKKGRLKDDVPSKRTSGGGIKLIPANPDAQEPGRMVDSKPEPSPPPSPPPAQAAPIQPQPRTPQAQEVPPGVSVEFGMVDLGGSEESKTPSLAEMPAAPPQQPAPQTDDSLDGMIEDLHEQPAAPVPQPTEQPAPTQKPEEAPYKPEAAPYKDNLPGQPGASRHLSEKDRIAKKGGKKAYKPVEAPPLPRRSYAKEIKIATIVLLILAVLGGAIFGIIKWREGVEAERKAEKDRLNSQSLDSMRDEALRKEGMK
jgi:hypothetical protein